MIAVDTNILVYAHREDSPFHEQALVCLTELAEGVAPWALPWPCLHEFYSVVTHPCIYDPPTSIAFVTDQIEAWLASPRIVLLNEQLGYWKILKALITSGQPEGPMIHDARIAALCMQHGVSTLLTADRDFGRFPPLKTRNPLLG